MSGNHMYFAVSGWSSMYSSIVELDAGGRRWVTFLQNLSQCQVCIFGSVRSSRSGNFSLSPVCHLLISSEVLELSISMFSLFSKLSLSQLSPLPQHSLLNSYFIGQTKPKILGLGVFCVGGQQGTDSQMFTHRLTGLFHWIVKPFSLWISQMNGHSH